MTIVRVGTNQKYAEGWEQAFGGAKSTKKKTATKASAKKKTSARKTAKKKTSRTKKKSR
jgi:hypothetical protein